MSTAISAKPYCCATTGSKELLTQKTKSNKQKNVHLLHHEQSLRTQTILNSHISHYDSYALILHWGPSATTTEGVWTYHGGRLGPKELFVPPPPLTTLIKTAELW